jgi:SecD/SecF fusion protein
LPAVIKNNRHYNMRNKGFFWFFTILIAVVSIYQLTFTFVGNNIEAEAEAEARELVEALKAQYGDENAPLPNGTVVNFATDREANDKALAAFINEILKEKGSEKVFLGNTFQEVKDKSISLGLDLKGGMSVTLELSMPDLVKNKAMNPRDLKFIKPFDAAVEEYNTKGGDFIDIFAAKHKEMNEDRSLIREFSTEEVVGVIGNKATDAEVIEYLKSLGASSLDGVEGIMQNRINQFGVAQPNITKDLERNRLYIELPGVKDQATVRARLQSTANLEFFLALKASEIGGFFNDLFVKTVDDESSLEDLLNKAPEDTLKTDEEAEISLDDLMAKDTVEKKQEVTEFARMFMPNIDRENRFAASPQLGFSKAKDTSRVNALVNEHAAELMLENIRFVWSAKGSKFEGNDTLYYTLYALQIPETGRARVGGQDISNARVSVNPDDGSIGVSVDMLGRGAEEWGDMTAENVGNFIAITMDNKVFSAPVIQGPIRGGSTLISGGFKAEEAKALATLLNAGALPAPCIIIDEAVVGPTIGAENSRSGLISFGIALFIVLLYMIFFYGKAGVVADIALLLNIIFIVGFLAAFGAVLTLAGIAGIVLTIGMSVDANVLIFERIREEIAEGKGMKLAVKDGYRNALSSIIDANVTTLLTAIVLKTFGSGPIESFATTLIIGIFTSVFAAIVITRLIFEYQLERKGNINFSTKLSDGAFKNFNFGFIKNRKKFYIVSVILVLVSLAGIFTRGLKPSVEFTGGRTYETVFENPVGDKIDAINAALRERLVYANNSSASVEVKKRNSEYRVEIATDYLQGVPNSEDSVRSSVLAALEANIDVFGAATIENSRSVSPSISAELKRSSLVSIILSLIIIFVYILIRFGKWQFGLGALLAMAHDVIIVLGAFALLHGIMPFNMEVDQAFIAAILTVVGYSINDTVVVFDRIREYLIKYRKRDRKTVINDALNATLSRTINTSLSTFVVLLTIFIFDGGAIKGFVFALMIGVIVGTYSSVCIATPAIVDLVKGGDKEEDEE